MSPTAVATVGALAGVVVGAVLASVRDALTRRHEDKTRWHEDRRRLYTDFVHVSTDLNGAINLFIGFGGSDLRPDDIGALAANTVRENEARLRRLHAEINLVAGSEAQRAVAELSAAMYAASNSVSLIESGLLPEEMEQLREGRQTRGAAISGFVAAARNELGVGNVMPLEPLDK
jgi:hypothetical protein